MARASFTDPAISEQENQETQENRPKGAKQRQSDPDYVRSEEQAPEETREEKTRRPGRPAKNQGDAGTQKPETGKEISTQAPAQQMTRQQGYMDDSDFEGELDANDLVLPYLTLVHATSDLAEVFDPGAFALGKDVQLGPKGSALDIIVVRAAKRFKEYVSQDNPEEARVFLTAQEVVENDGQLTNYGDDIAYFAGLGEFLFLIKKPKGIGEEFDLAFPYEIEGNHYALARYSAFRSAYTGVAKQIFNLKLYGKDIKGTAWKLSSIFTHRKENTYWVPKVVQMPASTVSAKVLEFIESIPD